MLTRSPALEKSNSIRWWPGFVVVCVGVAHRALLLAWHRDTIDALVLANPDWWTWQHLSVPVLRDHLGTGLWYLQQTPPLSNFVLGLALQLATAPLGVAHLLIAGQAALSIATAFLLCRTIGAARSASPWLGALVGIVFLLQGDLVVLEVNSFGQTIYENLGMFFAAALVLALVRLRESGRRRWCVGAAILVGLLALTRATWCFFAPVGAVLVWLAAPRQRWRHVFIFLTIATLLQGAWSVKNFFVFGRFSWSTSTWSGFFLANGLRAGGFGDDFWALVRDPRALDPPHPDWFALDLDRPNPYLGWPENPLLPESVKKIDREMFAALPGENLVGNSLANALHGQELQRSFAEFARRRPLDLVVKAIAAYRIFWLPMRYYGSYFVSPLAVQRVIRDPFDIAAQLRLAGEGRLPEVQATMAGTYPRRTFTPTTFFTLRWLEPLILVVNLVCVHLLLPLVLAGWAVAGARARRGALELPIPMPRVIALLGATTVFGYVAAVSSVGEMGENLRYRLGVEPAIWLISVLTLAECGDFARRVIKTKGRQDSRCRADPGPA